MLPSASRIAGAPRAGASAFLPLALLPLFAAACSGATPGGAVVISELMYKPFFENAAEDFHEFVELHNKGPTTARLGGWRLAGDAQFTFPDGTTLAPGAYLVVAKDRAKLTALPKYGLELGAVLGNYAGELGDGRKNHLSLFDATGSVVDAVTYSAEFPWPMGADGLGLAPSWVPMAQAHQYMGRSLERISVDAPASAVENWEASALDGATPGKANSVAGSPRAVAIEVSARPAGRADLLVKPTDRVTVRARFGELGTVTGVAVEFFIDDVSRTDETTTTVLATKGDMVWEAGLPAAAANSIVRYRIRADRGSGQHEVISPRSTDPNPWHAYFVNPDAPGKTPAYHVFITPNEWGNMWRNIEPGFVDGCGLGENAACTSCTVNPKWNESVPAVFVSEGRVFDVRTRYQGGKFARQTGRPLQAWPFPRPDYGHAPKFQALGWKVSFPKYARFDGLKSIKLNKRVQMCTGIPDAVTARVFESVGIPQPRMRYRRLYVNGGYYLYAMEVEEMDETFLARGFPGQAIGDLFECNAIRWDSGPWGWGDFRPLEPFCGYTAEERYAYTYGRQTLPWKDNREFIALLEGLHTSRSLGHAALAQYLDDHFDRDRVLRHLAVINWAGAWDDIFHNYDLYKPPGGKWMLLATDLNRLLTGPAVDLATNAGSLGNVEQSLYLGKEGEPFNYRGRWNFLKDAFLSVFKSEYDGLLKTLAQSALAPATVEQYVDEAVAAFDPVDASQALSTTNCDTTATEAEQVKAFVRGRYAVMQARLAF